MHAGLIALARDHPGTVELLAYRPGGRLEALDAMSAISSRGDDLVTALAPGRPAAASFEAVTGIETAVIGDVSPAETRSGLVVVAEAHRVGPWELSSVVASAAASGGRVVLLAPAARLEASFGTAATLARHVGRFAREAPSVPPGDGVPPERHCFAGREVLVVADGQAARETLLATWRRGRDSGQRPLVVASDDAVVARLRAWLLESGGSPGEVVETRRLAGRLAPPGRPSGRLVVLGRLPKGVAASSECVQVAIASPRLSAAERLGRAAEVAGPRYLVSELGPVPSRGPDRSAWRAGATAIEAFRARWSIDDREHALGDRSTMRALGPVAVGDLAETRLDLRHAASTLEARTPGRGRRPLEAPGRGR